MNEQARAAGRRLLPVYAEVDASTREAASKASCRRGCHHCCYNLAGVSLLEAIPIAEYLLTSELWKPKLKELRTELEIQAAIVDSLGGMGNEAAVAWLDRKLPCVFLKKNGECGVYPIRPIVCRTYFVVTPPEGCSPERNGNTVGVIDFYNLVLLFWAQTMTREKEPVPPVLDSLQRAVLLALELLERRKDGFLAWSKQSGVELRLVDVEALSSLL